jgi:hypothetical protein
MAAVLPPREHRPRSHCPPDIPRTGANFVANRGYSKRQKQLPTGIFWTVGIRMGDPIVPCSSLPLMGKSSSLVLPPFGARDDEPPSLPFGSSLVRPESFFRPGQRSLSCTERSGDQSRR